MTDNRQINHEHPESNPDIDNLNADPFVQFRYWFNDALKAHPGDANTMVLATADSNGRSSARVLLLKGFDKEGFVFFTNYNSMKGRQIAVNPNAALVFYWHELERQVRIEGRIEKTSRRESDEYFKIRPEESNISAVISPQSQRIPDRRYLEHLKHVHMNLFRNKIIERPENWGGYRLIPDLFEFWQGRENRLHDRFEYSWTSGGWEIHRLAP
jgi:pyridoxamine 5'-phosphate oxidase